MSSLMYSNNNTKEMNSGIKSIFRPEINVFIEESEVKRATGIGIGEIGN